MINEHSDLNAHGTRVIETVFWSDCVKIFECRSWNELLVKSKRLPAYVNMYMDGLRTVKFYEHFTTSQSDKHSTDSKQGRCIQLHALLCNENKPNNVTLMSIKLLKLLQLWVCEGILMHNSKVINEVLLFVMRTKLLGPSIELIIYQCLQLVSKALRCPTYRMFAEDSHRIHQCKR